MQRWLLSVMTGLGLCTGSPLFGSTLPSGFTESVVANGLSGPTAMEFAPDGRLFVCQQGGQLRVIKNGVLLAAPFVTVNVDNFGERGLLGIAFDPGFASNHWIYLYYTATTPAVHNRVSRFTANGDTAVAGSEVVILDLNNLSAAPYHNGGAIHFGSDGKLYIAVGDNGDSANSQTLANLLGKMLRINASGTIPTDNPFYNTASGVNRTIWSMGLRNPFTFAVQPGTGRMFINDVGQDTWEEINDAVAGANYGWPNCEGGCSPSNPNYRDPIFRYPHGSGTSAGNAITGGAFYDPATVQFPVSYVGVYFFSDYVNGWIRKLDPANGNQVSDFASGINAPVDLKVGADGRLYYLALGSGSIFAISATGSQAPQITQQPVDRTVAIGQSATFNIAASGTPPLSYQWQRNGVNISGATAASYTLSSAGASDDGAAFRCIVSNAYGTATSNPAYLHVASNNPPVGTITSPTAGMMYSAGDTIQFAGTASDPEDGTLPASAFSWAVVFHHDTHTHPFLGPVNAVKSGSFVIPTQGETSANVWYRISLTVTDSVGQTHTSFVDVLPRTARISLATTPPGLQVTLDGQPLTTPVSVLGVVGMNRTLGVVSPQTLNGTNYEFVSWSDGGSATHSIATPATDTTYTATFRDQSGGSASTYLLSEGFEGSGYENSGWTEGGTPNEDYTTTALHGAQSLNCVGAQYLWRTFRYSDSFNLYFCVRWNAWADYNNIISWDNVGWSTIASLWADDNRISINHGSVSANGTTSIAPNTTYHVWVEWTGGSGNNGTMKLYVSTDGIKPGIPEASITTGTGGATERMYMGPFAAGPNVIFDRILVDDVPIGSNPGGTQNQAPTIGNIPNQTINQGGTTGAIAFTVGDAETSASALTLSGSSSNPTLVPNGNIVFGGSGANRTVTVTPVAGQSGSATITVTVSDGTLTASDPFVVTVNPASNTAPTISNIPNQTINQGGTTGAIAFTIGDAETSTGGLTVSGSSSNPTLVPNGNIVFGGSGANRTVTVTPAAGQSGSATITVTVSDGSLTASDSFVLTVNSVSGPSYLLSEGFEGPGYENTGWIELGTPNENYTTMALHGAQSLNCVGAQYLQRTFRYSTSFNLYFRVRWNAWFDYNNIISWDNTGWSTVASVWADDNRIAINHGSVSRNGTTSIAVNTTYHVWVEWTRGSGINGTMKLYVSTDGTKPGTPEASITTGTGGGTERMYVGPFAAGPNVIFDRILVDDAVIGSNPPDGTQSITQSVMAVVEPPKPASVRLLGLTEAGHVTLRIDGDVGQRVAVEVSGDLIDWTALATLENADGTIQFTDSAATGEMQRFYRAVSVPTGN